MTSRARRGEPSCRRWAGVAALALLVAGGCVQPAPRYLDVDLGPGQARLAISDPALLEPLKSFIALMYWNPDGLNACADLVDTSLQDLEARGPLASQVVSLEGDDSSDEHAFGNVGESGVHSFLLLGSLKPKGLLRFQVDDGSGATVSSNPLVEGHASVIAVGCEEVDVRQFQRFDVPISLFPAGLR